MDYVNYTDADAEDITAFDAETWRKAMRSKMNSIKETDTWEFVPVPTGRKPMSCKWVFRYKYIFGSNQPKYKARLVAKGFKKEEGIN